MVYLSDIMKVFKYLILVVVILVAFAFGVNFLIAKKISTIENSQNLSPLDTYLFEHYSLSLHLDKKTEDIINVFCNQEQEDSLVSSAIDYACQNKNPIHKIVIGSANDDQSYITIIKSVGAEQLFWKNSIDGSSETGRMVCKEWFDAKGYNNVTSGINCITLSTGGTKLYSSIVFLEPETYLKRKVFIAVVNTLQTSSLEKTEQEIIALLRNQKISRTGRIIKFISFLRKDAIKIDSILEISSDDSLESKKTDTSLSSNFVTLASGDEIDGEVCDASKTSSCYPIYCNSSTAVWGKYLHRCVEPLVSSTAPLEGAICSGDLSVWDGSKCQVLTGDFISSNFCLIATGGNSCEMNFIWSVGSPQKKVEVKYLGTGIVTLSNATSGSLVYSFPFSEDPQTIGLFEGDKKINEGKFVTKCRFGGFDSVSKTCVAPSVFKAKVVGEYAVDKGKIVFSCELSDAYTVKSTEKEMIIATGTYSQEVRLPVSTSGNYSISCSKGSYNGSPIARYYNAPPPPPPILFLNLSPQAVVSTGTTTLEWSILYPRETCTLRAKSYCKAAGCTPGQSDSEEALNQILDTVNLNLDKSKQVNSTSTQDSLKKVGEDDSDNDLRVTGKKNLTISQTTDFILSCGDGIEVRKRIYTKKTQRLQE